MRRPFAIAALLVCAASAAGAQGAGWDRGPRVRHRDHRGLHVRIGGNYTVPQDTTISGPVILIGGNAFIFGHVQDDVVQIGGNLRIGPTAVIDGDLTMLGGNANVDPAAQVLGDVNHAHVTWPAIAWPAFPWPSVSSWPFAGWWSSGAFALGAMVVRLGLTLFVGLLLTLVAPGWMMAVSHRVSDLPGVSAVIGFATEMLLGPALVVIAIALVISIVGIPLLAAIPVLLAILACVAVAGFTALAARIGASLRGREAAWRAPRPGDFVLGFFLLTVITIAGRAMALGPAWMTPLAPIVAGTGLLIEYCAWTIGLGAAIGAFVQGRRPGSPPPIPPIPAA